MDGDKAGKRHEALRSSTGMSARKLKTTKILVPLVSRAGNFVMGYSMPSLRSLYQQDHLSNFIGIWVY